MTLLAKAEIESSERVRDRAHVLECEVHGRRFLVELVRQDTWEMWAGDQLLADGFVDFAEDVRAAPGSGAGRLTAEATVDPLEYPGVDTSLATEFRVAQEWKINNLSEAPTE